MVYVAGVCLKAYGSKAKKCFCSC